MQYGMGMAPGRKRVPGVVYANYLSAGNPAFISSDVVAYLKQADVTTVITGHQPHGDAPVVISNDGVRVITCDISYSNNVVWENDLGRQQAKSHNTKSSCADGNGQRGKAITEVCVESDGDGTPARIYLHGRLSTGEGYAFQLPEFSQKGSSGHQELVGRVTDDGWWIKAVLPNGKVLATKAEGFKVVNRISEPKELSFGTAK